MGKISNYHYELRNIKKVTTVLCKHEMCLTILSKTLIYERLTLPLSRNAKYSYSAPFSRCGNNISSL